MRIFIHKKIKYKIGIHVNDYLDFYILPHFGPKFSDQRSIGWLFWEFAFHWNKRDR